MSKLSRKFASIFIIAAFLATAGFGCKGMSAVEQQATKPVTLEYWTVFDDVDALRSLAAKFKADRPYTTVNIRQLTITEFYPRLLEALAEDKGPDIVSIANRSIPALASKLSPMPASVRDTTVRVVKGQFSTETQVSVNTVALPTADQIGKEYVQTVKKDSVTGGKTYGLPLSADTMAMYYNKDLMDRAGVAEPPKTWIEFQAAVKKITRYRRTVDPITGKENVQITQSGAALGTGNNIPGADDLLAVLFAQSGVDFTSRAGRAVFNTVPNTGSNENGTPAMNVMDFYTDFANPVKDTYTWNEGMDNALDKFLSGSLAFFFGYSYHLPIIRARAPDLNFDIAVLPQLDPEHPVNAASYWLQCVTQKSKYQNEAWAFVNYITHSKATKDYLDATGRPTALRTYIAEQSEKPELAPFASQVLVADNWYRGRDYDAASKAVKDMAKEWLAAVPADTDPFTWRQEILNRGASKVNQTL